MSGSQSTQTGGSTLANDRKIQISVPSLGEEEWRAMREPVESGWVTQGPKVAAFEQAFAELHQVPHAIAVTSGTTALHLALAALGITAGDEVILPSFTWIATANVVLYCGATPVFVDVDPVTYNLDPERLREALTGRTRAVIPVHLFGLCADMDAIREVLPEGVAIVEDAACAAGASYRGQVAGSIGDVGCFSFHPRKTITTGEGGMLTTSDAELAARARELRNHGAAVSDEMRELGPRPYLLADYESLGFNYRMTDMQGAMGVVQLAKLEGFITERAKWAAWYRAELAEFGWLRTPSEPEDGRHAWQAFVCNLDPSEAPLPRNELMDRLAQRGIATRPGTHAVHLQGYYAKRFGLAPTDLPNSLACDKNTVALPMHNCMSGEDYAYVVQVLREIVR